MSTRFSKAIYVLTCSLFLVVPFASAREWTDITGEHQFRAELVRVSADLATATFVGVNGKRHEIPVAALSKSDQAFAIAFAQKTLEQAKREAAMQTEKKAEGMADKLWSSELPEEVLYEMKQQAVKQFPADREKQLAYIKSAAKKYLNGDKSAEADASAEATASKPKSTSLLPDDIRSVESKSVTTPHGVPSAVVETLTQIAKKKWPKKKRRQVEYVKQQLGYYYVLQEFEVPELPALAVIQLKHQASKLSPTDYKAQLRYVYEQVKVGQSYLAESRSAPSEQNAR